jgi:hypothetical protein
MRGWIGPTRFTRKTDWFLSFRAHGPPTAFVPLLKRKMEIDNYRFQENVFGPFGLRSPKKFFLYDSKKLEI